MKTQKTLTVASEVQKAVLEQVLFPEMQKGFWKNVRPADHFDSWKGVQVVVGDAYGASGFDVPRNYNFVNPQFFKKTEATLMESANKVQDGITVKQLKKQLISLNQIIGSRIKEQNGAVTKLKRGKKAVTQATQKKTSTTVVKKAVAHIVETPEVEMA